jgi:hypothetical protein
MYGGKFQAPGPETEGAGCNEEAPFGVTDDFAWVDVLRKELPRPRARQIVPAKGVQALWIRKRHQSFEARTHAGDARKQRPITHR